MESKRMYAITHVGRYGRTLTFGNQGRNHYETREAAEAAMKLLRPSLRQVIGDAIDTLEVRWIDCYSHGDAKGIYFDNPHSTNENKTVTCQCADKSDYYEQEFESIGAPYTGKVCRKCGLEI